MLKDFLAAMSRDGVEFDGELLVDGRYHAFRSAADKHRSSWYILNSSTFGAFGSFRLGVSKVWTAKGRKPSTPEEIAKLKEWSDAATAEIRQRDEIHRNNARKVAARAMERARPASPDHPYLVKKRVKPFGVLMWRDHLIVPLRDMAGVLHTVQAIAPDGRKEFIRDGRVAGCFSSVGEIIGDNTLVVAEGFATACSVHEATDLPVVIAVSCGNLVPVVRALRQRWPAREIVVAGDDDLWSEGNPGRRWASEAAVGFNARLALPVFAQRQELDKWTDFNDLHCAEGLDVVRAQILAAWFPAESDNDMVKRLAGLSKLEYERQRALVADVRGIRTSALDAALAEAKRESKDQAGSGRAIRLSLPDPWHEAVAGAILLDELRDTFVRHLVLPPCAPEALSLWVLVSYVFDGALCTPILAVVSPVKRCGKTTLLRLLLRLACRALSAANLSPSSVFRVVDMATPTLLIDEADTFLSENVELRGILNSGHTKETAYVIRNHGDNHEPRQFSTWAPKAIAMIGRLPDTLHDRALVITMKRRLGHEKVVKLPASFTGSDLRRKAQRWAVDNIEAFRSLSATVPPSLHDRAGDNWLPLLCVAELAGGHWPDTARNAAVTLSAGGDDADEGLSVMLLRDIHGIFTAREADRVSTKDLLSALVALDERPWADYRRGQPINPRQLAGMLGRFGVASGSIRLPDGSTPKGYTLGAFEEVFTRYLPGTPQNSRNNATEGVNKGDNSENGSATHPPCGETENATNANVDGHCGDVAAEKGVPPEGSSKYDAS